MPILAPHSRTFQFVSSITLSSSTGLMGYDSFRGVLFFMLKLLLSGSFAFVELLPGNVHGRTIDCSIPTFQLLSPQVCVARSYCCFCKFNSLTFKGRVRGARLPAILRPRIPQPKRRWPSQILACYVLFHLLIVLLEVSCIKWSYTYAETCVTYKWHRGCKCCTRTYPQEGCLLRSYINVFKYAPPSEYERRNKPGAEFCDR
jgi:hypothetical protein